MLAKAKLVEIKWDAKQQQAEDVPGGKQVAVQFNPQTLKVTYANENKGGDQPGGNTKQFVGSGTSKLSVELLFDTTESGKDVRKTTEEVAYFIKAKPQADKKNTRVPPGISLQWGSFIFRGVMDSLQETLDYFSEEGVPLRATLLLSIARQDIEFQFGTAAASAGAGAPATAPLTPAQPGDNLPKMAGRDGKSGDWKAIASANNIDDPLRLSAGTLLNLNVSAGVSAGASAQFGGSVGLSGGVGIAAGAGAGASAGGSAGVTASAGAGVGISNQ